MKTKLLFIGALFFLLMAMPSYAQKPVKKQKENKTERVLKKKGKKMEVLTEKKKEQINPKLNKQPKVEKVREKVNHSPIDPITGEQPDNSGNNGPDTGTRITSPTRNTSFTEIPILIKGTAKKHSKIEVTIRTTYKKYGQDGTEEETFRARSGNDGKWSIGDISSIKVDKADDKVTHQIMAVRIEDNRKKGNMATETVYTNPKENTSLKITSPSSAVRKNANIAVRGRAIPNTKVQVTVLVQGDHGSGSTSNGWYKVKDWHTVTTGSNGYWKTSIIKFKSNENIQASKVQFLIKAKDKDDSQNNDNVTIKELK